MSGNKDSNQRPRDFVGAVAHVMDVLQAFDAESSKMTLSDISKRTGLDRAGARRYLLSLEYLGYIKRNDKIFSLSPKILKLGYSYMATIPLSRIAQEILLEITEKTGETSALAILDGLYVVHISKADSRKRLGLNVTIGRRFPALDTSTGRVFMAFMPSEELQIMVEKLGATTISDWNKQHKVDLGEELEKIRKQGYAIVDQEVEEGVRSVAVPVNDSTGRLVGAINILTTVALVSDKKLMNDIVPTLINSAKILERSVI